MKKKIVSKGYTLSVTSWENDGDHYQTNDVVLQDKDEAIKLARIYTTLFKSCNNNDGGIGNSCDIDDVMPNLEAYAENHPELFEGVDIENEDVLHAVAEEWAGKAMGCSDFYFFRVCSKATITYSPIDVMLEEIKF